MSNERPEPRDLSVLARTICEEAQGTDDIVQVRAAVIRLYNIVVQMTDDNERLRAVLDELETAEAPCGHLERWWKVEPNQDAWCVMCALEELNGTAAMYMTTLQEIAQYRPGDDDAPGYDCGYVDGWNDAADIARAALGLDQQPYDAGADLMDGETGGTCAECG